MFYFVLLFLQRKFYHKTPIRRQVCRENSEYRNHCCYQTFYLDFKNAKWADTVDCWETGLNLQKFLARGLRLSQPSRSRAFWFLYTGSRLSRQLHHQWSTEVKAIWARCIWQADTYGLHKFGIYLPLTRHYILRLWRKKHLYCAPAAPAVRQQWGNLIGATAIKVIGLIQCRHPRTGGWLFLGLMTQVAGCRRWIDLRNPLSRIPDSPKDNRT